MPSVAHYLEEYDREHSSGWNNLLHGVGVPLIFAGIILLIPRRWTVGSSLFVGDWLRLFAGHRIEGNRSAFFSGAGLFVSRGKLGGKRSMDVPRGSKPFTERRSQKDEWSLSVLFCVE